MRALLLAAALAAPAAAEKNVILFLGDSLTAGYGLAPEEAYPALLAQRWSKEGLGWKVRNAGVSGITTAGVVENLDWNLADDVRTVFLAIGANDGLRGLPLAETRKNISLIMEKARKKGARVALAGIKIPPNYGQAYSRGFEKLYPELAKRHKAKLLPFLLDGVAGRPDLNIEDGIHPNARGHRAMADLVDRFFKKEGLLR
jgi:acyl-CoA thioesterase-1